MGDWRGRQWGEGERRNEVKNEEGSVLLLLSQAAQFVSVAGSELLPVCWSHELICLSDNLTPILPYYNAMWRQNWRRWNMKDHAILWVKNITILTTMIPTARAITKTSIAKYRLIIQIQKDEILEWRNKEQQVNSNKNNEIKIVQTNKQKKTPSTWRLTFELLSERMMPQDMKDEEICTMWMA